MNVPSHPSILTGSPNIEGKIDVANESPRADSSVSIQNYPLPVTTPNETQND